MSAHITVLEHYAEIFYISNVNIQINKINEFE